MMRIKRALEVKIWRRYNWLRFHLLDHRRHDRLVLERVGGLDLVILPQVFNPRLFWTSELLRAYLEEVPIKGETRVLDLGTGSGIGAVFAAQRSESVTAVDINPEAVRCARINSLLNRVEKRVSVHCGDLFDPVLGMQFDLILFNPPFLHGEAKSALDAAFYGGDLAERFAAALPAHLSSKGSCLLALSSQGDSSRFLDGLHKNLLQVKPVKDQRLPGETLTIYQVTAANGTINGRA